MAKYRFLNERGDEESSAAFDDDDRAHEWAKDTADTFGLRSWTLQRVTIQGTVDVAIGLPPIP